MGGISIRTKGILIFAILLTAIISLGCISAADADSIDADVLSDTVVSDVDTAVADPVETEPADLSDSLEESEPITTEPSDVADLQEQSDVIADDSVSPKNELKANALGADDVGTFTELYNAIKNGGTVTLNKSYAYNAATDSDLVGGMTLATDLTLNGNGHTIDGKNTARIFILNGYTTLLGAYWHGYTYTLRDINFVNAYSTTLGGAITSQQYPNTVTISNCNFTNNRGARGGAFYGSVQSSTLIRYVDDGSISITGCVFKDNYASDNGGAIYSGVSNDHSYITANNNVFINNSAAGAAKVVFYASTTYLDVNYNWWGQNAWSNGFVAQSASSYITPTIRYQAAFAQTSGNTVRLTLTLNGGSAPAGSSLPMRNAIFTIATGFVRPENQLFRDSIDATYVALKNTTITATVDNQHFSLDVSNTPRETINVFTISVANVVLPDKAVIVADSDVNGTFNVTIGDTVKEITLTNGHGTLTWDSLPAGQYFAVLECINNLYYNDKFTYTTFKVEKQNVSITVSASPNPATTGETITFSNTLNDSAATAGTVTYYIDGVETAGSLNDLGPGTYKLVAKYTGDPNFNDAESEPITITVNKPIPVLELIAYNATYKNVPSVSILVRKATGDLAGIENIPVFITVNGVTYGVFTDALGNAYVLLNDLDANEEGYPIAVKTFETDDYASVSDNSEKLIVYKIDSELTISADKLDIVYGETVSLSSVLTQGATGDVTYYVNGTPIEGDTLSNLAPGEYNVTAKYAGSTNYKAADSTNSLKITVDKANASITVSATPDAVTYGDGQTITLSADVTPGDQGEVTYYVDGEAITGETLSGLDAGTYIVYAVVAEDTNYKSASSDSITFTVKRADASITIDANASSIKLGDTIKLSYTLTSGDQGEVTYFLDGVAITGDVLSDLSVGTHTVVAKVAQDTNYNAAESNTLLITVGKMGTVIEGQDITVYATVSNTITFTLKDANGNILANKPITVAFDGKTYDLTSDSNGVITVEDVTMINKGTYSISASYAGDDNYEATFASYNVVVKAKATKLTVSDQTYSVSGTKYVTAKLTAGGQPIANKLVTFSLNGKTYTGRTNAEGVVKVAVSLTAKKTYSVVVSFAGDTTYGSAVATYKLKVTS